MGALWSLLFGRSVDVNGVSYKVVRRIGEGGFSYVDLVRTTNGQIYALKQVLLQVEDQRVAVNEEIRIHNTIKHSNVLKLINSHIAERPNGEAVGYLVFPYYQRGTLEDEIDRVKGREGWIGEKDLLKLFISVCKGLYAMHTCPSEPLAHRDLKPGNLLLTDDKTELILMDLGSAACGNETITTRQEALALQEHCAQTCTAMFRAPELFEVPSECVITVKTDVWSFGCTLYAAAFGSSPVDGSALGAMSGRIMFPRGHPYSQQFCNLVMWILKVEPSDRPSVVEMEQRISSIINDMDDVIDV